jgi:V/A-type H+-transporting ATPase subunit K
MTNEMMQNLALIGGYSAVAFAAMGSALGTGTAGSSAIGAWKKCYAQNKPAPFLLMALAGAPLSQTIYGLVMLMFIKGKAAEMPQAWPLLLVVGVVGGIAMGFSAWYQGRAGAGGCDAFAETGKGFANYLMILGVVETVAIFALVFSFLAMPDAKKIDDTSVKAPIAQVEAVTTK